MPNKVISYIFFGSSPISVTALDALESAGFVPKAIVTQPDRPQGRGLEILPSPVKTWSMKRELPVFTPEKLSDSQFLGHLYTFSADVFVLVSYGKIIPKEILAMPKKGVLNLHPSLLPKLRGPSPIEGTILNDMRDEVGVSIMLLDEKMDEGPILAQSKILILNWPPHKHDLYKILAESGARLLANTLPSYMEGNIKPVPQDASQATYCKLIKKEDGEINLNDDAYKNFLKIRAFEGWPGTYFFVDKGGVKVRVKITEATFENNDLKILRVIPEGKNEMSYEDFRKRL